MNYIGTTITKSIISSNAGDSATLIYEVPALHQAEISLIKVSNDDANNREVNIQLKTNGTYGYFIRKFAVSNSTVTEFLGASRIYLKAGDCIVAYKESGTYNMDITLSLKLSYRGVSSV